MYLWKKSSFKPVARLWKLNLDNRLLKWYNIKPVLCVLWWIMGVICSWRIYAELLTKKFDKKCSAPNKLLLHSLSLFCESPFAISCCILKNWKLTIRTTTTNHLMEYRAYWMKVKYTSLFSVERWCFINPILHPTSHLFILMELLTHASITIHIKIRKKAAM